MSNNHHHDHVWSSTYSLVLSKTGSPQVAADEADAALSRFKRATGQQAAPAQDAPPEPAEG